MIRRTPNGTLTVVAGTGKSGFAGDGGRALNAELDNPSGMAVASDGTIYLADTGNNRVRAISPSGIITTVAGNGQAGSSGQSGPAIDKAVAQPVAVARGSDGRIYVVDNDGIQLVWPNGTLSTLLAAGPGALTINGTPTAFYPSAVAVSNIGDLYVADSSPKLLVEFSPTGQMVNSWPIYVTAAGLATAPDGSILAADYGNFAIDRIVNNLTVLATFKLNSLAGLAGTFRPSGVAVTSAGQVYADTNGVNGGTDQPAVVSISSTGQAQLLTTGTGTSH